MKKTQVNIVKDILNETGRISRNHCLSMFISRLSAIIQILEDEGYVFTTQHVKGDYVYILSGRPKPKPLNEYQKLHQRMQNK